MATAVNDYGDPVEEIEISLLKGEPIDCERANAVELSTTPMLVNSSICVMPWKTGRPTLQLYDRQIFYDS